MPLNFTLPTTTGTQQELKSLRGRATLLIYETPDGKDLNEQAKLALMRRVGEDPEVADRVQLIPVANLAKVNNALMRPAVLAMVQKAAKDLGEPIWMDWQGMLASSLGWNAPSVFAVVDKKGEIRGTWQGKFSNDDIASMIAKLIEVDAE